MEQRAPCVVSIAMILLAHTQICLGEVIRYVRRAPVGCQCERKGVPSLAALATYCGNYTLYHLF
jgi:hypothetical protein